MSRVGASSKARNAKLFMSNVPSAAAAAYSSASESSARMSASSALRNDRPAPPCLLLNRPNDPPLVDGHAAVVIAAWNLGTQWGRCKNTHCLCNHLPHGLED